MNQQRIEELRKRLEGWPQGMKNYAAPRYRRRELNTLSIGLLRALEETQSALRVAARHMANDTDMGVFTEEIKRESTLQAWDDAVNRKADRIA